MKRDLSESAGPLEEIIRLLAEAYGLDVARYESGFLQRTIAKRMAVTGAGTIPGYAGQLAGDREEAQRLWSSLRITHTDFFRNPLTFAVIEQVVLPALVEAKKKSGGEIRVWSAGCASGQEAWSLAILLDEVAGPVAYRIFSTDLEEPVLARSGVYGGAAVGNIRTRHLHEYFSRQGDTYSVSPRLRERMDFSACDLLDGATAIPAASIYGDFDLILCCNLMFYYRPGARKRIMDRIMPALMPGGYFVTGGVEKGIVADYGKLHAVVPPAAVFRTDPRT